MQKSMTAIAVAMAMLACAIGGVSAAPAADQNDAAPPPTARQVMEQVTHDVLAILQDHNLSADQKTQAKAIFQAAKQAGAPIRTQLQANRQAMVAAIKAGDAAQIQSLATAGGALQGQLMANRASAMAKLYAMLTPDQQTKLDQMQAKIQQLVQQLRGDGQTGN